MASELRASHIVHGVLLEARHGDLCKEEVGAIVNAANEFLSHGGGVAKSIANAAGCNGIVDKESAEWVAKNGPVLTGRVAAITSAGALPCKFVVHVAGPIWRKPVENEIEVRGEIISVENGVATLMAPECGTITCRRHTLASGYVPQEGDRARACVIKPRPTPPGKSKAGSGGYSVRYIAGTKHEMSHSDEELLEGAVLAALRKADEAKCESVALPAISSGIFGFPLALCAQILVKCGIAFANEGPKCIKRIAFTNIDVKTVTGVVNAFKDAFGAESIAAAAAAAAASKTLSDDKGKNISGPLLIDVDAAGNVVDKAPCPRTTSANVAKMKADGYLFHASGPFRNNWVRGMPPPGEAVVAQTFDPRGDWGTSRHGVSRAVPGMEEPPIESAGGKGKKKKKKGKTSGAAEDKDSDEDQGVPQETASAQKNPEILTQDDLNKRIKAVNKKLTQARELAAAAAQGTKELNADQKAKVANIHEMEAEVEKLSEQLALL